MYGKENDQTHGSDVYFCNKKARNIWMSFRFTPLKPKAHSYVSGLFITKIYITVMRLIIFLTIHLIIMAKSTISYIKTKVG